MNNIDWSNKALENRLKAYCHISKQNKKIADDLREKFFALINSYTDEQIVGHFGTTFKEKQASIKFE